MKTIYQKGLYRIVEIADYDYDLDDLKGDCFNPEVNPDINIDLLKNQEHDFENLVIREGVYGYRLERWDAQVGCGWEVIDSCYGFIGEYNPELPDFNHCIVEELISLIPNN